MNSGGAATDSICAHVRADASSAAIRALQERTSKRFLTERSQAGGINYPGQRVHAEDVLNVENKREMMCYVLVQS